MTFHLVAAIGDRRRNLTVLMALVAAAVMMAAVAPAPAGAATTNHPPVLAQGAGMGAKPNAAVRRVQRVLHSRGYSLGRPGVDGRFGPLTDAAVRHFQADSGLAADGIVGAKTNKVVSRIERRQQRSSSARRTGSRTKQASLPKLVTTSPPAAKTAPAATKDDGSTSTAWLLVIALAAVAAFCVAIAASVLRRPGRRPAGGPSVAPLSHELYLEGHSADESVADFRGPAIATSVMREPGEAPAKTWYLVDDARKPAPVWVSDDDVRRSPSRLAPGEPVIGYVTVSSEGKSHEADGAVHEIEAACESAGWELVEVVTDRESGRGLERPGLAYALRQIAEGKARGLLVNDLRRLSRSIVDLGSLMEWFRDAGAGLIALDLGVDTSTPGGHEVAATLITLGDWERERIARRTRSGLAEVRASGRPTGRPKLSDRPDLVERITAMRAASMTLQAIADQLNAEGVPTLRGGAMWRPSSVQAALGYRRPGSRTRRDQFPTLEDRA
jgi:DNA invertase Pin-like site-specific DNA recombinase/peptidoglycan hydrolase-like protein with peptidoglycan-binding domain